MRKWLATVLLGSLLVSGCMAGGGGSQPQRAPEPSSDEVKKAVKSTLSDTEMKDYIRTQVRTASGNEMLELALDTQEGQKAIHDAVNRALTSATGQQAITKKVGDMMADPQFKLQVQQAIRETLTEMLAKGTDSGKAKSKSGGDQTSGGKAGAGGGGGGGGGSSGGGGGSSS